MNEPESDPSLKKLTLPAFSNLTIRQLRWLHELREHGQPAEIVRHYEGVTHSMLSRDLSEVSSVLGIPQFYTIESGDVKLTPEAEKIIAAFEPGLEVLSHFREEYINPIRQVRIGSGGSILAWLISPNAEKLRDVCGAGVNSVQLSCSPIKNREVVSWIISGALDFGFVRASLFDSIRKSVAENIGQIMIGEVEYALAVPDVILERPRTRYLERLRDGREPVGEVQKKILTEEFVTTVGPEGEFWLKLSNAMERERIKINVEFSYRSFPQVIPHLIAGTHVAIVPSPPKWKVEIPGCRLFPLELLSDYKRRIALVWNKKLAPQWFDPDAVNSIVSFWR